MPRTLILLFHPDLRRSRANAAMAAAAAALPGTEVVDMTAACPDGLDFARDTAREAARLLNADRLVLQFPVQWYSTPPLLKAWQDAVLTRMFYLNYETEGQRLQGTPLMIAATAGNTPDAYRPGGQNLFAMTDLMAPLRATAHRCAMPWTEPFVLYCANKLTPADIDTAAARYADRLTCWDAPRKTHSNSHHSDQQVIRSLTR